MKILASVLSTEGRGPERTQNTDQVIVMFKIRLGALDPSGRSRGGELWLDSGLLWM